jgi:hypothetical protein
LGINPEQKTRKIIILVKKCYFVNGFNRFVDKNTCTLYGRQLYKVDTLNPAKRGAPFPLLMLLLILTWRKSYELTKKE